MKDLITQQQAEQLLENATPGPWYLHENDWDGCIIVNDAGRDMTWDDQLRVIIKAGYLEDDGKLIASAPDLARTVIWLWKQNQQQQAKIKRLQAGVLETSRSEWAYATPDDMEDELESLIEGDMK